MLKINRPNSADFLAGGGEMGALTRAYDWSRSPLGKPETWPQSLRTAVRILLNTNHPMLIWWSPELIQFYNDAYRQTMGPERHPSALGQRGRECWAEIWDIIGPQIAQVMSGAGATWHENQLVPVTRHGKLEQVHWTSGFTPLAEDEAIGAVRAWHENQRVPVTGQGKVEQVNWTYGFSQIDEDDGIGGVLVVCRDVTKEHLAAGKLREREAELAELNAALAQRVEEKTRERDRIWNVSQDLLVVADRDGVWRTVNPAWTKTLGWSEAELFNRTSESLYPPY